MQKSITQKDIRKMKVASILYLIYRFLYSIMMFMGKVVQRNFTENVLWIGATLGVLFILYAYIKTISG